MLTLIIEAEWQEDAAISKGKMRIGKLVEEEEEEEEEEKISCGRGKF